jgi:hypothetical protein
MIIYTSHFCHNNFIKVDNFTPHQRCILKRFQFFAGKYKNLFQLSTQTTSKTIQGGAENNDAHFFLPFFGFFSIFRANLTLSQWMKPYNG